MEWFFAWMLESSLLVLMIFGIRNIFTGKIPYALTYALWLIVLLRFLIPVNFISTPVSVANIVTQAFSSGEEADRQTAYETGSQNEGLANPASVSVSQFSQEASSLQTGGEAGRTDGKMAGADIEKPEDMKTNRVAEKMNAPEVRWGQIFVSLWMAGAVILLVFIVWSNLRLSLKLKKDRILYGQRGRIRIYLVSEWKNPCLC